MADPRIAIRWEWRWLSLTQMFRLRCDFTIFVYLPSSMCYVNNNGYTIRNWKSDTTLTEINCIVRYLATTLPHVYCVCVCFFFFFLAGGYRVRCRAWRTWNRLLTAVKRWRNEHIENVVLSRRRNSFFSIDTYPRLCLKRFAAMRNCCYWCRMYLQFYVPCDVSQSASDFLK